MSRLDGIYLKVRETISKPPTRRRIAWAALISLVLGGAIFGLVALKPLHKTHATITAQVAGVADTTQIPNFSVEETPAFAIKTDGMIRTKDTRTWKGKFEAGKDKIETQLTFRDKPSDIAPEITVDKSKDDQFNLKIPQPTQFKPGKYHLEVHISSGSQTQTLTQDFTWGVLAMNFDKSTYTVGQKVAIEMAVLDDMGHTICDAGLKVTITAPDGKQSELSTDDKTITVSDTCGDAKHTNKPDYVGTFEPSLNGTYQVNLTAQTKNGERQMIQTFDVKEADFVLSRPDTSMRIYPIGKYNVNLHLEANQDFNGNIYESAPASFEISGISEDGRIENLQDIANAPLRNQSRTKNSASDASTNSDQNQIISWPVNIQAGQTVDLAYLYQPPAVFPEFYLLRMQMKDTSGKIIFSEPRPWEIASDANYPCAPIAPGTGGAKEWTTAGNWTNCNSGYPGQNDPTANTYNVSVTETVAVTWNFLSSPTYAISSLSVTGNGVNHTIALAGNNLSTTTALSSTGAVTLNAPSSNGVTNTISTTSGTFDAAGLITIDGANSSKATTMTTATGSIKGRAGITITNNANASLTVTSTGHLYLGGTFAASANGVLTLNAGSTFHTIGSATFNKASTTFGNVSLDASSTLALGTAITVAGTGGTGASSNWLDNSSDSVMSGNYVVTFSGAAPGIGGSYNTNFYGVILNATTKGVLYHAITVGGGNLVLNASGTTQTHLDQNTYDLTVNGTVTLSAPSAAITDTWAIGTATATVSGAISFASATATYINKMTVTSGTLNANGGITAGNTTASLHVVDMSGAPGTGWLKLKGAMAAGSFTFTMGTSGSNFAYVDSAAQTVNIPGSGAYNNLVIYNTNASGASMGAALPAANISGNLLVGDGSNTIYFNSAYNITGNGGSTIFHVYNSATFSMTGASDNHPTGFATFTFDSTSTVNYKQTVTPLTLPSTPAGYLTYGHLGLMAAGNATQNFPAAVVNIAGNLTIGNGTANVTTAVANGANNLNVAGNWLIQTNSLFTHSNGTVVFNGASGTQTVNTAGTGANHDFYTLQHTGASVMQLSAAYAVTNTFLNNGGNFNANGVAATYTGLATVQAGSYLASSATQTFNGGLTLTGGTFTGAGGSVVVSGDVNVSSGTLTAPSGTFSITGSYTNAGTFTSGSNTVTFNGTAIGKTINTGGTGVGKDFYNVIFSGSGGVWSPLTNTMTVTNDLTMTAGTLNTSNGTANVTVNGNVVGTNGIIDMTTAGTNTFTQRVGATGKTFGNTSSANNWSFYNLTFSNSGGSDYTITTNSTSGSGQIVIKAAGTLQVGNSDTNRTTLTNVANDRIIDCNGSINIVAKGTLIASDTASFTVAQNWTIDSAGGGVFTASGGTVTFDAGDGTTQTFSGSTTFGVFTANNGGAADRTLKFTDGSLQTMATLNIAGGSGHKVLLTRTGSGANWQINPTVAVTVTYVNVDHSTNNGVEFCATFSTDTGDNNTGWNVGAGATCPINISGSTNLGDGLTVKVAINGSLAAQTGTTGTSAWSIANVTVTSGQSVIVFIDSATPSNQATDVTKFDGSGYTIGSMVLNSNVLTIGSADNQSMALSNIDDFTCASVNGNNVMDSVAANVLTVNGTGCIGGDHNYSDSTINVLANNTLTIAGTETLSAHNVSTAASGVLATNSTGGNAAILVSGSWDNNGTFTATTSNVTFTSTAAATETVDPSGSGTSSFNNAIFGNGASSTTWNLSSALDVNGGLTISYGTLSMNGNHQINVAGALLINNSGNYTKDGTATAKLIIDGGAAQNFTSRGQDMGNLQLSTASTNITLQDSLDADNITIDGSTTLTANSKAISCAGTWANSGTFTPGTQTTTFDAGSTKTISNSTSSFSSVTFNNGSGSWSFINNPTTTISGDMTVTSGSLTGATDITVNGGNVTGDGTINLSGGTFNLRSSGNFGGATAWTFYHLTFGDGSTSATTTKAGSGAISVTGQLSVLNAHNLQAGTNATWNLDSMGGLSNLESIKMVSAGSFHTCALKSDGTRVYCWGDNGSGQIGINNTTSPQTTPQEVLGVGGTGKLSGISQVSAGQYHTCALKSDGTRVYCWGRNVEGQIGINNTTDPQTTPQEVLGVGGTGNLSGISQVSAGGDHTCALKSDGTRVYCWGDNGSGQIGINNTTSPQTTPQEVLGVGGTGKLSGISQVSAGYYHTCALKSDGTRVYCWGRNSDGEIGINNTSDPQTTPQEVLGVGGTGNLSGISQVSAGGSGITVTAHTCALKSDGTRVYCWGRNSEGQIGINNTTSPQTTPQEVLGVGGTGNLSGISQVSAGGNHTCALKSDGTRVYCWGTNASGQIGINNTTSPKTTPQEVLGVGGTGNLSGISQISAGYSHTCALKSDGTRVYCWGTNTSGQIGINNTTSPQTTPQEVLGVGGTGNLSGISQVSAGFYHTCALKSDGTRVYCWGWNLYGQIGINNTTDPQTTPQEVLGVGGTGKLSGISQVIAGGNHTCALKSDGTRVYCWGRNIEGQIGINNTTHPQTTPQEVLGVGGTGKLSGISQVSAGGDHTCALKSDGTRVYCWGRNDYGQIGINNVTTPQTTPQEVLGVGGTGNLSGISQVSAGYSHTCALKSDGTRVYCWGRNDYGQIGINNVTTPQTTPQEVLGVGGTGNLSGISQVSAGYSHTCALKSDGTRVYCWGYNLSGQIGINNTTTPQTTPQEVLGVGGTGKLSGISQVSAGGNHTCALKSDYTLGYYWGFLPQYLSDALYVPITMTNLEMTPLSLSGTITAQTSTFNYQPSANPSNFNQSLIKIAIANTTYNNLSVNGTNRFFNLTAAATANNNVTITSGNLDATYSNYNLTVGGSYANSDTFTAHSNTVTFNDTAGGKTLTGTMTSTSAFNNLTFDGSGGGWSVNNDLTANGDFHLTHGTLTHGATANLLFTGNVDIAAGTTFTKSSGSGLFKMDGDAGTEYFDDETSPKQDMGSIQIGASPGTTNLKSDMSGTNLTILTGDTYKTHGWDVTLSGYLDCQGNCTFDARDQAPNNAGNQTIITVAGNYTMSSNVGASFTIDTGASGTKNIFNGTANQTWTDGTKTYNRVQFNNTGGSSDIVISGTPLDIDGAFDITDGVFKLSTNNPNVNISANVAIASAGSVAKGSGTMTFDGSSTTYSDSSSGGPQDFGTVTIGPSTTTTLATNSNMGATKVTIGADDTFNIDSDILTLTGTGTGASRPLVKTGGGTFTTTSSTVTYTGSGSDTGVETTVYNNLTFTPGSATNYLLTGDLTAANSAAMTGSLTLSNANATLDAVNGSGYDIELPVNWDNSGGGTFTPRTGIVTFTGGDGTTQSITGSTTFNVFTANNGGAADRTVKFGDGTTQTMATLNISGGSGHKVLLRRTGSGANFHINPTSAATVTYIDVDHSTNDGIYFCATYSTEAGDNNTNWSIGAADSCGITISGTSGAGMNNGDTIRVAVAGTIAVGKTDTIDTGTNTWELTLVNVNANESVIVWVDTATEANQATAISKYDGSGNMTGMSLVNDVLAIGSANANGVTLADADDFTCSSVDGANVMHQVASNTLYVQGDTGGCSHNYTDEKINILASNTLNISGTETLTTHNVNISGTLTSGGASTYNVSGSWVTAGTWTASSSTVDFNASTSETLTTGGVGAGKLFNNLTHSGTGSLQLVTNNLDVDGNFNNSNASGTFDANNLNINIAGSYANAGAFTAGTSTVTFDATSGSKTLSGHLNNVGSTSAFYKVKFDGGTGNTPSWVIGDAMYVTAANASDTMVIGDGTVTLGNGSGDNLEVDGRLTIAATSGQTGTLQTAEVAQGGSIMIQMNKDVNTQCAQCIIQVGTTGVDAGQGNFKPRKNSIIRLLADNTGGSASDTGIEVEKNGYLDVEGNPDYQDSGGIDSVTYDAGATITLNDVHGYTVNENQNKVVRIRNTSSLAFGKIYDISSNAANSITIPDAYDIEDSTTTLGGAGATRTVTTSVSMITANDEGIGQYIYNMSDGTYFQIVDSVNNGVTDVFTITSIPDSFPANFTGDTIRRVDGIKATDQYEILDYAKIGTSSDFTCTDPYTTPTNGAAYVYAKQYSQTNIQYADVCNLGRGSTKAGLFFESVNGANSNEGIIIDKSRIRDNAYGIIFSGSSNNFSSKGLTSNAVYKNNSYGISINSSNNNYLANNTIFSNNTGSGINVSGGNRNLIESNIISNQSSDDGISIFGNLNILASNKSYNNYGGIAVYSITSDSLKNILFSNECYGNNNLGIQLSSEYEMHSGAKNTYLFSNQIYSNSVRGIYFRNASGYGNKDSISINDNFGSLGANGTDIVYDAYPHNHRMYNTTYSTVSGVTTANAYLASFKDNGNAGVTKIWNDYAFATDSSETPQVETIDKYNYADASWVKSATPHGYSGTGTEDSDLNYDLSGATLSGGPYAYKITANTNNQVCASTTFDVYRNGVDTTQDATCGSLFTDATTGVKFQVDGGVAAKYLYGDTYTFVTWDSSNDTNTTKSVTMMQDNDTYTIAAGKTLQSVGDATHKTAWTTGGGGGTGYALINQGIFNSQFSIFNYLKGPTGIDFQTGSSLTNLDYTDFDNMVATGGTDAYIQVAATVIDGGNKTLDADNFTTAGADNNVRRTGTSVVGNTWNFTAWGGTMDGENSDDETAGVPAEPGMVTWGTKGITISGSSDMRTGDTVKVAVAGALQAGKTGTINAGTGNWSISNVAVASTNSVVVFPDTGIAANQSTGISKYDGSGDITGMVLNANVLSIGSVDNASLALSDVDDYTCASSANVMHSVAASVFNLNGQSCSGGGNHAYDNPKVDILASNGLTISNTETMTTHNLDIHGTLTSGGNSIYNISGSYYNGGTFVEGTSTANFTSTTSETLSGTMNVANTSAFYKMTFNGSGGSWVIQDPMYVTAANASDTMVIGDGTVTLGNGTGDNLEVDGRLTIAATSGQTGTLQTAEVAQGGSIIIQMNKDVNTQCAQCVIQVGTTGVDAGQGNFKPRKNSIIRLLADNTGGSASDTGIEVEKNGYLDVEGTQDYTDNGGIDSKSYNEGGSTETINDVHGYTVNENQNKVIRIRNTASLAFGKIYDISSNAADSLTFTDPNPTTDAGASIAGSGATRTITSSTSLISSNDQGIGQYVYNETDSTYFQIVDSVNNGATDQLVITSIPDSFPGSLAGKTIKIDDGIKATDQYEILDYAKIGTSSDFTCTDPYTTPTNGAAYVYAKQYSQTNIQYADMCNLGRNTGTKYGLYFNAVNGANSNEGITINKSKVRDSYYGIGNDGSGNNGSKGITNNSIFQHNYSGIMVGGSNNQFSYNDIYNNSTGTSNGIDVTSSQNLISYNSLHNNKYAGIYFESSGGIDNTLISNNVYNNTNYGVRFGGGATNNIISSNIIFGNPTNGIYVQTVSNNTFIANQIYENNYGIQLWTATTPVTGIVSVGDNFGGYGANSTADINFNAFAHNLRLYNTTYSTVSGVTTANAYLASYKDNGNAGQTKIWNDYAFATDSSETPQDETIDKYNYNDALWGKSTTPHGWSGSGTEDTNIQPDLSAASLGSGPYAYKITAKVAGACDGTHAVFDVYRNGVDVGDMTCNVGSQYTDTDSGVNVKWTIEGGPYVVGDTYTFVAFAGSGDSSVTKSVTMMQDNDTYTIAASKTLQSVGDATHKTAWTTGGGGGTGYALINQGIFNSQFSIFNYLKGPTGIDFQTGSSLTNLDYTDFDNMVATGGADAYIQVAATVIDAGNKTLDADNFTTAGADNNVRRTGTSVVGNTWNFTAWGGTMDGENSDDETAGVPAEPGMVTWGTKGITISGSSDMRTGDTVKVAVAGSIATGKTGTISAVNGNWSINNVAVASTNSVVVFPDTGTAGNQSTGISKYDGSGDMTGMVLNANVLSVGSVDAASLALSDVDDYTCANDNRVMHSVAASVFTVEGCGHSYTDGKIDVLASNTLTIGNTETLTTHNVQIDGTLTSSGNAIYNVSGSWDNNSVFTASTSTITFTSTAAATETVDSTGASTSSFNNLVFGNGASSTTWNLSSALDVNAGLTISYGTLSMNGNHQINVAGALLINNSGLYTKDGTATASLIMDGGATQGFTSRGQDMGNVQTATAGTHVDLNDALDTDNLTIAGSTTLHTNNYNLTIAGNWVNSGTFTYSTTDKVTFDKGSGTQTLNSGGTGAGKTFRAIEHTGAGILQLLTNAIQVDSTFLNNGGNYDASTNSLASTFTGLATVQAGSYLAGSATQTFNGGLTLTGGTYTGGGGTTDVNGDVTITTGTLTAPSGTFTISGSYANNGGTFTAGTNTVTFDATDAGHTLSGRLNNDVTSSAFYKVVFNGSGGSWVINDSMLVSAANDANAMNVDVGTVTVGDNGGETLEVDGRLNIAKTSGNTATLQTAEVAQTASPITIQMNKDVNTQCAQCVIQVGTTGADNGQGNFKPRKNSIIKLIPDDTGGSASDTGIEIEKNGYLDVEGYQDYTGTSDGTTNETTMTDSGKGWTADENNGKVVRITNTSSLAFGKIYDIADTTATTLVRADNSSADSTIGSSSGSDQTRTVCAAANNLITANNEGIGRYLHNQTDDTWFKVVDSTNNDAGCTNNDSFVIIAEPTADFTSLTNGDAIDISDGVRANDTYEILDYASITGPNGTSCSDPYTTPTSGAAYVYAKASSQTLIQYADICNLGRNTNTKYGFQVDASGTASNGILANKSRFRLGYYGTYSKGANNNSDYSEGFTKNAFYSNNADGLISSGANNLIDSNSFYANLDKGLEISYGYRQTVSNNYAYNNTNSGFHLTGGDGTKVTGNVAYKNGSSSVAAGINIVNENGGIQVLNNITFGNNASGITNARPDYIGGNYSYANETNGLFIVDTKSIVFNNTFYKNSRGINIYWNRLTNSVFSSNNIYSNTYGIRSDAGAGLASTNNYLIKNNFGSSGVNTTADVSFIGNVASTAFGFDNTYASSTEVNGFTFAGSFFISKKHEGAGVTKIWNDYSIPDANSETPQSEETDKFNYADNLYDNSFSAHTYSVGGGAGTEDSDLNYGIDGSFGGDNSVYNYSIICTASNCVTTPNSWDVYRNGTKLTNPATTGSTYTDNQADGGSAPNVQFKIDDAGTDYTAGANYMFTAWKASGDTNTTKSVTMMQDNDTYTIASGKTLQSVGDATHKTAWTKGGGGGTGYNIINQGAVKMQYSTVDYLKGPNGIDFQSGSSLTNLDYTTFDNMVSAGASDAYIKVLASVIDGGGASKTNTNNVWNNTGSTAEYNVFRSGTSTGSGYTWTNPGSTGALSGEANDYEPDGTPADPPGMIVWNQTPTNDSLTFTNPYSSNIAVADDTTSWIFRALVTDLDGPTDINYVELRFANSSDNSQPYDSLKFRWTESTDTFSEQADTQDAATITSTAANSNAVGNQWTLDFKIKFNNNFTTKDTGYAAELYTIDDSSASDNDNYANLYQVTAISISFSIDNNIVNFANLNASNSWTDTKQNQIETTTNAPSGYNVRMYKNQLLTSTKNPAHTIDDFNAGSWNTPAGWAGGTYGFGYTSSDTSVAGSDRFNNNPCPGGGTPSCYAPASSSPSGDIVADDSGPVSAKDYNITYKVATTDYQVSETYQTTVTYIVTGNY